MNSPGQPSFPHTRPARGVEGPPPILCCPKLPGFDATDLREVLDVFQDSPPTELRQAWLEAPEESFAPAVVRTGWAGDSLLVFAEMRDEDIFNSATGHNERMWELGDTFEVYLQGEGQTSYVELHVTPNNWRLQLRYHASEGRHGSFAEALLPGRLFESTTWIRPAGKRWFVFATIPAKTVCGAGGRLDGGRWRFSFCRYDYTKGRKEPVLSSTSPHAAPDFHRRHEWSVMTFR